MVKMKGSLRISVGKECPTDSTMYIDDTEFLIEGDSWNLITDIMIGRLKGDEEAIDRLLDYIKDSEYARQI